MMRRKLIWSLPLAGAIGAGALADRWLAAEALADAKQDLKPAVTLPVTRVVMFNSGVGYFSRSGEVDGDARVDLTFQEADINDLIKSMVLEDFGGGRVAAVSYDSREPIARTLASFSINLNGETSFAGILHQARGERVEVTTNPTAQNQPGKLTGSIVGIETQAAPGGANQPPVPVAVLNLWCAEGLRAVKLTEVQQLRFLNPVIESEFRRALEVLALNHDAAKKAVSLHFAGDGKRRVQVGYVVEAPVWKTSYRLVLDAEGKGGKPYLQGWVVVENPTDEDWTGVRMALISGRPISFKMDLYNPLYVPRPTVEPELFASLRPPTYDGGFGRRFADGVAVFTPAGGVVSGGGQAPPGRPRQDAPASMPVPAPTAGPVGAAAAPAGGDVALRLARVANDQAAEHGRLMERELAARLGPVRSAAPQRAASSATSSSTPSTTPSRSPARSRRCCRSSARRSRGRG